ncbi:uncharacterized protein THITE_2117382 [Thermothielavioides terrestris NRRL 8126]|uniref:Haloacid dehalogenase n=1 Tax=Thermothielavioides terrestris (strain ATCC 38088 / NRRL 8126) TaxID=578455 RepID=G2R7Z8_THETT|nr:uncharacterized protein THITE_2117382 [Thermothielavioides terrestris NRRL 8126]AEO68057.1 hypothetical protein THITE_2117382 [Thermothielavioides terrestris NRRL 8126]
MANKTIIAFDLYGTLLSTDSIAAELAKTVGHDAARSLATLWRRYQLEYSWRISSMSHYRPFSAITRASLQHAAAELGLALPEPDIERVMKAYDSLHVFPDVPPALQQLENAPWVDAYVFSNGTPAALAASVRNSPDLGPHAHVLKGLVSVDEVEVFKPDRRTYEYLLRRVGKEDAPHGVWLVSSNPFDALGAVAAGLRSAWVDRGGKGWIDRLGDVLGDMRPTLVVSGVDEAVREIQRRLDDTPTA